MYVWCRDKKIYSVDCPYLLPRKCQLIMCLNCIQNNYFQHFGCVAAFVICASARILNDQK